MFKEQAAACGLPEKIGYTVAEVSRVSGVPRSTLRDAVADGSLESFLPPGRCRGTLVRPEWFDAWWESGRA